MESKYLKGLVDRRIDRRRLLKAGGAFSMGAASLALWACGGGKGTKSSGSSGASSAASTTGASSTPTSARSSLYTLSQGQPRKGGKLTKIHTGTNNQSVLDNGQNGANIYGVTVYDRPITGKLDDRRYQLEAMEKIELVSPTKVVMTLKPNLVYQDKAPVSGRKVLASDIKATQEYIQNDTSAYNVTLQKGFLDSVEAPDDRTVIFNLSKPSAYLLTGFYLGSPHSQPIIPRETLDVVRDQPPIGSGPFELTDFQFNQTYSFKRFEKYRDADKVYFDQRDAVYITDPVAAESAFRSGQLSYWEPGLNIVDRLKGELDPKKFANIDYLNLGFDGLNSMMDPAKGGPRPWHDVRVRQAIYRLIDRQQLISLAYRGHAIVPPGLVPAGLPAAYQLDPKESAELTKTDVAEAKKLLSAASYDTSKTWEAITGADTSEAEVLQHQLALGGFNIRPVSPPFSVFIENIRNAKFDFWIGPSTATDSPARPLRYQHSTTGFAFSNMGLYDPQIDKLIEQSETETDFQKHAELVKEVQRKALASYTLCYLLSTQKTTLFYDARLQNLEIDVTYGGTYHVGTWYNS